MEYKIQRNKLGNYRIIEMNDLGEVHNIHKNDIQTLKEARHFRNNLIKSNTWDDCSIEDIDDVDEIEEEVFRIFDN